MPNIVGGFICFAYGDQLCLRLGLYRQYLSYKTNNDSIDRKGSLWETDFIYNNKTGGVVAVSTKDIKGS